MDMNSTRELASAVSSLLTREDCSLGCSGYLLVADLLRNAPLKKVADVGFQIVKNWNIDFKARDTIWWASQALKKHRGNGVFDADRLSAEAKAGFLQRNTYVAGQRLWWPLKDNVRQLLNEALPEIDPSEAEGHFGPGAVAEGVDQIRRWNLLNDCDFDPRDPAPLPDFSGKMADTFIQLSPRRDFDKNRDCVARLVAVPKDAWRMRLISVEPGRNSFLQQLARSIMLKSIHSGVLRNTPSDFLSRIDNVEIQQRRCLRSSDHLQTSTIDLRDASDYINVEDVFDVFPAWLIPWLERSRTPYVDAGDEPVRLWMYGGMGNATTFLVETLYFWAVVEAVGRYLRIPAKATVFGDDIILNTRLAQHPLFPSLIERGGLHLNMEKSCYEPGVRMREACGMVAYNGRPLSRLVRLQAPGSGDVGLVLEADIANRLRLHPAEIAQTLSRLVRREEVPVYFSRPCQLRTPWGLELRWSNPCAGYYLEPGNPSLSDSPLRLSRRYQRYEAKVLTLKGSVLSLRRRTLSGPEALAVIGRHVKTEPAGVRTRLTASIPYATRAVRRWVPLDGI